MAVVVLLAACSNGGDDGGGTAGPGPSADEELAGRTFLFDVRDGAETIVELEFRDGDLAVRGACNTFSGTWGLTGDALDVGEMEGTDIGCPEPAPLVDAAFLEVLSSSPTVEVTARQLVLEGGLTVRLDDQGATPTEGFDAQVCEADEFAFGADCLLIDDFRDTGPIGPAEPPVTVAGG